MISEKIKAIRNLFDLSQKDFANKLNVSFRRIQDYEYGRTAPSFDVLQKIIQEFQIEPDYFFEINCRSLAGVHSKNIAGVLPESKKNIAGVHSSPQESINHQKVVHQEDSLVRKKDSLVDSLVDKKGLVSQSSPQDSSAIQKNKFRNGSAIHSSPQDLSPSMSPSPSSPPIDPNSYYIIPKLTLHAQAGGGNEILDLECYESGEMLTIDKAFFKVIPSYKLKAIKVEGYSMIPMLLPDSWVVFEERREYKGDGLYIINYAGQLMVKLLQLDPVRKILDIVSVNKEYKSYSIPLSESQVEFIIIGKVLRCII